MLETSARLVFLDRDTQGAQKVYILRVKRFVPSRSFGLAGASSSETGCCSTSFNPIVASSMSRTSKPCLRMSCTTSEMCSDSETDS